MNLPIEPSFQLIKLLFYFYIKEGAHRIGGANQHIPHKRSLKGCHYFGRLSYQWRGFPVELRPSTLASSLHPGVLLERKMPAFVRNEWTVCSDTKKGWLLTGPTQLRTSVAFLAISSSEAGLLISQIIIPTSDESVALPKVKKKKAFHSSPSQHETS